MMKLFRLLTLAMVFPCSFSTAAQARAHNSSHASLSQATDDNRSSKEREPEIKEKPAPSNLKGENAAWQGTVIVRMILRANGKVTDITILQGGTPEINKAVVKAAKKIKFKPAEKDGRKVSQYVTIEYNFNVY